VFDCVGDGIHFYKGSLTAKPDALARLRARAQIGKVQESWVTYRNRDGDIRLPFDVALDLARRFCSAEPSTILVNIEASEREWDQKVRHGDDYIVPLLNEYRAAWALIRQWAGQDAAIAQREAEIQKLERLVWDAVYALQRAGLDSEAARLRRAIGKD
jgi:hypothetical protein